MYMCVFSNLHNLFDQPWLTLPRVGAQNTCLSHLHNLFDRLWYASQLPLNPRLYKISIYSLQLI